MAMVLTQAAQGLDLSWTQGDPVSLAAVIEGGADWAGDYVVESDNATIAQMVATVVADGADASLTLTLSAVLSASVPVSNKHWWRLQQVGGATRLRGRVHVE